VLGDLGGNGEITERRARMAVSISNYKASQSSRVCRWAEVREKDGGNRTVWEREGKPGRI
jgi:hypothetical protein